MFDCVCFHANVGLRCPRLPRRLPSSCPAAPAALPTSWHPGTCLLRAAAATWTQFEKRAAAAASSGQQRPAAAQRNEKGKNKPLVAVNERRFQKQRQTTNTEAKRVQQTQTNVTTKNANKKHHTTGRRMADMESKINALPFRRLQSGRNKHHCNAFDTLLRMRCLWMRAMFAFIGLEYIGIKTFTTTTISTFANASASTSASSSSSRIFQCWLR